MPAIGLCPRREVSGHLSIQPPSLSAGRVNAAIWRQIREHHDQAFLQGDEADQVHEERLARSVFPDDEPDCRSAIGYPVHVLNELFNLPDAADLNMAQT